MTDVTTRPARGGSGHAGTIVLLSVFAMLPAVAAAEVRLSTYVHKVETYSGDGGLQRRLVDADSVLPGDELRYTITFTNLGNEVVAAGSILITNPLPEDTEYVPGTAAGQDTVITFSGDGESFGSSEGLLTADGAPTIRWLYENELEPGESSSVSFSLRLEPEE